MQRISRAPVLSATLRRDSCWITERHLSRNSCSGAAKTEQRKDAGSIRSRWLRMRPRTTRCDGLQPHPECEGCRRWRSLSCLHDFREAPALRLGQRARLDDADDVADVRGVLLVVSVELHAPPDDLLVALVRGDQVDLDDDRLVHCARDHDAAALLAPAAIVLGLRLADDRLPLRARRRAAARLRRPQAAGDALPLLLRFGLGRRSGFRFGRGLFGRGLFSCWLFGRRRRLLRSRFLGGGLLCSGFLDGGLFRNRLFRGGLLGCRLLGRRLLGHRLLGRGVLDRSLGLDRGLLSRLRRGRSLLDLLFVLLVLAHETVFAFSASRSLTTVRIRAISRLASLRRAEFSSAPVTDWKRRLNSSCRRSASRCSRSSSLRSRNSDALVKRALPLSSRPSSSPRASGRRGAAPP